MKNKENELFARWRSKRTKLVPDGVINNKAYQENGIKVMYILKEVNGGEERNHKWDLRIFLAGENGGRSKTWNNIARWQYGIENFENKNLWEKVKRVDKAFRSEQLNKISAINLKKEPGGATSKMGEIWDYAWTDREYLKEQISLYDAHIIICCGTGDIVKEYKLVEDEYFKDWKTSSSGLNYFITKNQKVIISHCHPQNRRISIKDKLTKLVETIKITEELMKSSIH